jgi:chromosome partitioning protein
MDRPKGVGVTHVIVLGNEKGGSGKSTTAMHLATALARMGHVVGAIDLDLRQRSFGRYIENRRGTIAARGLDLAAPVLADLPVAIADAASPAGAGAGASDARLTAAVAALQAHSDFIVIDCPGSHTPLSQQAHSLADTLLTPLNDSFVDFDMLGRVDADGATIKGPSVYSEMVWQARQQRARAGQKPMDWIVLRNRLGTQDMHNKRKVGRALENLSQRIGFRVVPGFSERVIFRELFPSGMTLLDLRELGVDRLNISNLAARNELRDLIRALNLPGVDVTF